MTSDRPNADPDTASHNRSTITVDPEPPTVAEIAAARGAVLGLCERAVRAGRADIASELRAAIGPLADAETATRRERQALEPDTTLGATA